MRATVEGFAHSVALASSPDDLRSALTHLSARMGFGFFALTHHVDLRDAPGGTIRLHNYPPAWVDYFDSNQLSVSDPIHRASHMTSIGFDWVRVPEMIDLTVRDRQILERAALQGIGNGFTVPANIPGEACGSCSFALPPGLAVPVEALPIAQLAGGFAFESARRLWQVRSRPVSAKAALTDRQRDCVLWVARGKTDWEIARILSVSPETVVRHIKQARERYGVEKRTSLLVRAMFDGTISFGDILKR